MVEAAGKASRSASQCASDSGFADRKMEKWEKWGQLERGGFSRRVQEGHKRLDYHERKPGPKGGWRGGRQGGLKSANCLGFIWIIIRVGTLMMTLMIVRLERSKSLPVSVLASRRTQIVHARTVREVSRGLPQHQRDPGPAPPMFPHRGKPCLGMPGQPDVARPPSPHDIPSQVLSGAFWKLVSRPENLVL